MALARSTRLGPYEILNKLGAGGMGEVYRARDVRLERDVAIKILSESAAHEQLALARFQREAKAVAALSHPNIMAIYDVGSEAGVAYAVMELLEGQSLAGRLKQGPLPWREALDVALAIVEGLAAAHAKGIIHRDVKPDNVFLTTDRGVKVLDFGLARIDNKGLGLNATLSLETQPGVLLGTVSYMSPEQVRGHTADARSDLFSFGCLLYEMLTGRRPFEGESGADVMAAVLHSPPPSLSESGRSHPADFDRIIARCLEKVPAQRFQSAREVANALQAVPRDGSGVMRETRVGHDTARASAPQTQGPSVAVLPFVNMSPDPENEYFSDGLAEELLIALSKVEGLHVASRTSSFAYKGKNEDVRKIGQQLNVSTVLEGSVRKAGQRLRVSAQLVNVADGYHLWSETYNRQLEDVFAIQDEIAQNIVKALRVILTEKDRRALEKPADAPDVKAYEFYLRGRQFFHQFRRKGYEFAQQTFAHAIAIDPNYAKAYAGIADCHSQLFTYWETTEEHLHGADEASLKALQLGPDLAEAHLSRGMALSLKKEFDEAGREFETAIRLDPNLFEAYYYGRACKAQGKLEQATKLFEQACKVQPDAYQPAIHLNSHYVALGRHEEAQASCRRSLRIVEKHLELHPDDARALYLGATVWSQLGEPSKAVEWASQALAMDPEEPVTLYNVACVYALQGEIEKAIDCLEKSLKCGFAHKAWIINDSDLNALHSHARYEALLASMGAARH